MYQVSVPISVPVTKTKKFYLNLNQYRNAHHFTLSKAKANYHDIVEPLLRGLPAFSRIHLDFLLFTGSAQLCDTPNICSIVDKFFSDVLVACQKIPDDNHQVVLSVRYRYGGIDRSDPRVEVTITPDEVLSGSPSTNQPKGNTEMQIIIDQNDIEEAIRQHVLERIAVKDNMRIDIDLKATRGDAGYTAIIDIVEKSSARRPATSSDSDGGASSGAKSSSSSGAKSSTGSGTGAGAKAAAPKETAAKAKAPLFSAPKAEPEVEAKGDDQPVEQETIATESMESLAETVETGTDQGGEAEAQPETVAETAVEAPQEPPKKPSLFGNLKTPQNA